MLAMLADTGEIKWAEICPQLRHVPPEKRADVWANIQAMRRCKL